MKVMKATHFKIQDENKWMPCPENARGAVRINFTEILSSDLLFPMLTIVRIVFNQYLSDGSTFEVIFVVHL